MRMGVNRPEMWSDRQSWRLTGKLEVMQTVGAAVFARMPSGRDTAKTPAHCGLNAPPAASQASVPGVASVRQTML